MSTEREPSAAGNGDEGSDTDFTIGVEEEFQIVDPHTHELRQDVDVSSPPPRTRSAIR